MGFARVMVAIWFVFASLCGFARMLDWLDDQCAEPLAVAFSTIAWFLLRAFLVWIFILAGTFG